MNDYPFFAINEENSMDLKEFKQMDYYAVEKLELSIELMMENAGLQLANLVSRVTSKDARILIGAGNGNNGGGGLVAARRLSAWGYDVFLDTPFEITKDLPKTQLQRAANFGVQLESLQNPDVWIDAYLGFSQRLPLPEVLEERIKRANSTNCLRVSLDLPTGFLGVNTSLYFDAKKVLSLAAPKRILLALEDSIELYVADLGLPGKVYKYFNALYPPFYKGSILALNRF